MNKGLSKIYLILFLLVLLSTSVLLSTFYLKTGELPEFGGLKQTAKINPKEGFAISGEVDGYADVGYSVISDNGNALLLVGRLTGISQENDSIIGDVEVSANEKSIIRVSFVPDTTNNKFYLQEQRTNILFPDSSQYTMHQVDSTQLKGELSQRIGNVFLFTIIKDYSECNQLYINSKISKSKDSIKCNLSVSQISLRIK